MWERNKLDGTVERMCTKYTVIKYRRKDVKGRKKDSKMKVENYENNKEIKTKRKEEETEKYKRVDMYCNNR